MISQEGRAIREEEPLECVTGVSVCVCVDIHLSVFVDSFHLKCHQWKSRPPLGNNEQTSGGREEMIASMINSSPP